MGLLSGLFSAIGGLCKAFVAVFAAKNSKDEVSNKEAQEVENIRADARKNPNGFDQDVAP